MQSFAEKHCCNDGIVLFYYPERAIFRLWNSTYAHEKYQSSLHCIVHSTSAQRSHQIFLKMPPPPNRKDTVPRVVTELFCGVGGLLQTTYFLGLVYSGKLLNEHSIALIEVFL